MVAHDSKELPRFRGSVAMRKAALDRFHWRKTPVGLCLHLRRGAGCCWRITVRDAGRPPSLYTFRPAVDGSARRYPRVSSRAAFAVFFPFSVAHIKNLIGFVLRVKEKPHCRRTLADVVRCPL